MLLELAERNAYLHAQDLCSGKSKHAQMNPFMSVASQSCDTQSSSFA
jgi:hypothetical protein